MTVFHIKCYVAFTGYFIKCRQTIFMNQTLMLRFTVLKNDLNKFFESIFRGEISICILKEQPLLMCIFAFLCWNNLFQVSDSQNVVPRPAASVLPTEVSEMRHSRYPALEAWSLSQWTTEEVPSYALLTEELVLLIVYT